MKTFNLLFFLITVNLAAQTLEKNANLKAFSSVTTTHYYDTGKKTGWSIKYKLADGKVIERENYLRNKLTQKVLYINDPYNGITTEIQKYDINKGVINDTLNCIYTWNRAGQLIEKKYEFGYLEKYSDFDNQNLPQIIERNNTAMDSITGYREELKYDQFGNITQEQIYSKIDKKLLVETNDYTYDKFGNLIEVRRNSDPKETYPIPMAGGRFHYEIEKYRYVYNNLHLWTEQYWIVENKEYLIAKRKFK